MQVEELIARAKTGLILRNPFYATIALKLPIVEDNNCKTMSTDGTSISYNPKFVLEICKTQIGDYSVDKLKGTIAHEVLHITNLHHLRGQNRKHNKWNAACDYAINHLLIESGFTLPEGALLDSTYNGMSAEKIYSLLPDSMENDESSTGIGEVCQFKGSESEIREQEQKVKIEVTQAANIAKAQGRLPASLQKMVDELCEPVINWKSVLSRFMVESVKNDFTWRMPNKNYIWNDIYLPSMYSEEIGKGIIFMDTSGSVGIREQTILVNEVQGILSAYKNIELEVVYYDTKIEGTETITCDDVPVNLHPIGGGGTNYRPVFEYVNKEGIEPLFAINLTDGQCWSFPDNEPEYPVLWVLTNKTTFKPPFGEVLYVKEF